MGDEGRSRLPGRLAATLKIEFPRSLFLRLLGATFLVAFLSLWVQVEGLIGSRGILPLGPFLDLLRERLGAERYYVFPTLFWIDSSDVALQVAPACGVLFSVVLILGFAPAPALAVLWILYLSLTTACRTFLGFQWDNLLLEAGFLSIFFAPLSARLRPGANPPASRVALWLLRWLLFRLMFLSGLVKLTSGDPTWRDLTALTYHYETQPLPTVVGWYAHQLPAWFQKASVVGTFAIELLVPFFIFAPGRWRRSALFPLVALQLLIASTGNYAFFNLLTLALNLTLLKEPESPASGVRWPPWVTAPLAAVIITISTTQVLDAMRLRVRWPAPILWLDEALSPLRSVNSYGLFAVMTTSRPEIVIEGSNDGETWREYELRWKPGDLRRAPKWVAPHQPRLDWQLWFAALSSYDQNPWFMALLSRIAEGSPPVLALLSRNPFPESPPRYLRALVYDYHFTDRETLRRDGVWWRRELKGLYCPVVSRVD